MKISLLYTIQTTPIVDEMLQPLEFEDEMPTAADRIGEFAGRGCYRSFDRPREETRTSRGYHANIQARRHFNIYEHVSFPFLVQGVSRHLLGEFTRHRFHQFSVESLRFCPPREFVVHPTLEEAAEDDREIYEALERAWLSAEEEYEFLSERLSDRGDLSKKEIREACAQVLPLMTSTDLVVSANLRAWRDVIKLRAAEGANREIRQLARLFLEPLKELAPNTFQDIEVEA
ncbi:MULTISPECIES: FAD-dependent thymidylate synthase [Streptosporangium]|uniref:FAD-dependent thymidylate synthase n=1 Tax=Streptosporangium brasiliense TaxID=47480 RepID=A0ABT9RMC9_9ACTN|nr:FAD-dependent thymidylate synthase [Streptosporangium brasiliense]MDP9870420.1 thymidylate synthase (FAD) [Streptosporangium brasiliense]